jgi:hypothetical protein
MVLFRIQIYCRLTHETEELKEHAKFGLFNAQAIKRAFNRTKLWSYSFKMSQH